MTRTLTVLATLLALAPLARAQDMPLSDILIEGEGWKQVEGKPEMPKEGLLLRVGSEAGGQRMSARVGGREITIVEGRDLTDAGPHALVLTSGGETALLGYPSKAAVWAFRVDDRGRLSDGAPYCPLRRRRGATYSEVTGLAIDRDGRIYAATEIGVQVFDPTGRLCGVLTPAAPGRPDHLAFEGDQLTMWIGDAKYTRKLNTRGVSGRPRSETPATEK